MLLSKETKLNQVWEFYLFKMIYKDHEISFQTFFLWALLLIVHTWNSSPLRSNLLRLQCTCSTIPTTSGRPHGGPLSSPQFSHNDSLWANSLWQEWSCELVHCPAGNATDPIWRVLASSQGISSWTLLKPQHSNPNPNPLANQLWCIDFLTPPTPLIIPHILPGFLESLMSLKNPCLVHARSSKSSLTHSIRFCGGMFFQV